LLSLPNGLHFTKITVALDEGIHSVMDLVSGCSDTLESISVFFHPGYVTFSFCDRSIPYRLWDVDTSEMPPLDLSKATKLKDVEFRCGRPNIQWITMTLQSIESKNLQQIIIHCSFYLPKPGWGNRTSGMAGPRPPVGPILDLTRNSSEARVWAGGE
jgi:hypothetical protein